MKKTTHSFLGFVMLLIMVSCSTTELFVEPKQIEPDLQDDIVIFRQDFLHNLEVKDSVKLFNSEIITLEKSFHFKNYHVKDGIRQRVDSFIFVKKTILPFTCGRAVKINKDEWGVIQNIVVSFSEEKGDESYNLSFFAIEKEGWFLLSGGGATYRFRGKDYPLDVATKGSCILMVKPPERSTIYTRTFNILKGWRKE